MGMRGGNGDDVMVVTVKKSELIEILTKNKAKHVDEFKQACAIYRKKVLEEYGAFKSGIAEFLHTWEAATDFNKLPDFPRLHTQLTRPVSYEDAYDRALGMLKLHTKDEMTLDMTSYRKYIEDEWEWSSSAKLSNASYLSSR